MTTSISMNIFPIYTPPLATFQRLRDAGFGAVDFNYCDYADDPDLQGEKFATYVDELKAAGKKTGIQFYQAHAPCITWWQDKKERERLWLLTDHCLKTTAALDVQWLVFHPLADV